MATKQGEASQPGGAPYFSHSVHMEDMFFRFLRSTSGRLLGGGRLGVSDLYAVYCAGFTEGVWTERAHPGMRKGNEDGR